MWYFVWLEKAIRAALGLDELSEDSDKDTGTAASNAYGHWIHYRVPEGLGS